MSEPELSIHDIEAIVDLDKYPIADSGSSAFAALICRCQEDLASVGSVSLPGFIREFVISRMAAEVSELPAYNRLEIVNPYGLNAPTLQQQVAPEQMNVGHPLVRKFPQDVHAVAEDCVPAGALIRRVYDSPIVASFLAKVLNIETLYRFADEFQGLNIMYIYDGGNRAWHFDGSEFVVTLMLQPPLEGGEFEFSPFVRGAVEGGRRDEKFGEVSKVLAGQHASGFKTQVKRSEAGTLNLFYGMRSLHRVRTVFGPRKRIMAVLSYHTDPERTGTPATNVMLYGERVRKIYEERGLTI